MRFPRVRVTVRWLMALTALSALGIWSSMMARRAYVFHSRAQYHALLALARSDSLAGDLDRARMKQANFERYRRQVEEADRGYEAGARAEGKTAEEVEAVLSEMRAKHEYPESRRHVEFLAHEIELAAQDNESVRYHRKLADKYYYAMWHPWQRRSPDPPEPYPVPPVPPSSLPPSSLESSSTTPGSLPPLPSGPSPFGTDG